MVKYNVAPPGMDPAPRGPYPIEEGMMSRRTPPTAMPGTPWSHPLMTRRRPIENASGFPWREEASKTTAAASGGKPCWEPV